MNTWGRLEDETEEEYIDRICSCKDEIGYWDDVADIINENTGLRHGESYYRKNYIRRTTGDDLYGTGRRPRGTEYLSDEELRIQEELRELRAERQKLLADKLELNRSCRQDARFEAFYEKIADRIEQLPLPDMRPIAPSAESLNRDYVLTLSDLHYGSTYDSINNKYSRSICKERLRKLLSETIEYLKYEGATHVNVVSLGDMIQGMIHMTDIKLNDIPVVDAVVEVSRIVAGFLSVLSGYVKVDYYAVSSANHGQTRPIGSKASEIATEDMERIIGNYITDLLSNNNNVTVHFDTDVDYIKFNLFGKYNVMAIHGHQVKNIADAVKDLSFLYQDTIDYLFMGHYHTNIEQTVCERGDHNVQVFVCPSIIGSCPYSDKIMKSSKSSAKMYVFDDQHGCIENKTFILN